MNSIHHKKDFVISLLPPIISLIASFPIFLVIFGGFQALNPRNFQWIEGDNTSGYLAQLFYLSDRWRWPLGANPNFGLDLSTSPTYTGPPFPILFLQKLLRLNPSLQFIGLWLLIGIALQIYFGIKISREVGLNNVPAIMSGFLFVMPFYIYRFQFHFWLTNHFLILWAISYSIRFVKDSNKRTFEACAIISLSYLINTYILAMVLIVISFPVFFWISKRKAFSREYGLHSLFAFFSIFILWFIIDFGSQQATMYEDLRMIFTGQYTFYPANILTLLNPAVGYSRDCSTGHCIFGRSKIPNYVISNFSSSNIDLGGVQGNFDAFTYLGAGVIFLVALSILIYSLRNGVSGLISQFRRNFVLVIYLSLVVLYAVTYRISFSNFEFTLTDSKLLRWSLSVFRSSGRFMWIVAYLLITLALFALHRLVREKILLGILVCALAIQFCDVGKPLWSHFHELRSLNHQAIVIDPGLREFFLNESKFRTEAVYFPPGGQIGYPSLAYVAWQAGLSSGMFQTSRLNGLKRDRLEKVWRAKICSIDIHQDQLVVMPQSEFKSFEDCLKNQAKLDVKEYGGFVFLKSIS